MASLILISEDLQRQTFPLGKGKSIIGRDDTALIRLSNESISRNHASITRDDHGNYLWKIVDPPMAPM